MATLSPEIAIEDLKIFLGKSSYVLSEEACSIMLAAEELAYEYNVSFTPYELILYGALSKSKALRDCVTQYEGNPFFGMELIKNKVPDYRFPNESYSRDGLSPYSSKKDRKYATTRVRIADYIIAIGRRNSNKIITGNDIVSILLDIHEEENPVISNGNWVDNRLHVDFNTISHITGHYDKSLWVRFNDVRTELGLVDPKEFQQFPVQSASLEVRPSLMRLLN
jgi:hypothetical protein